MLPQFIIEWPVMTSYTPQLDESNSWIGQLLPQIIHSQSNNERNAAFSIAWPKGSTSAFADLLCLRVASRCEQRQGAYWLQVAVHHRRVREGNAVCRRHRPPVRHTAPLHNAAALAAHHCRHPLQRSPQPGLPHQVNLLLFCLAGSDSSHAFIQCR